MVRRLTLLVAAACLMQVPAATAAARFTSNWFKSPTGNIRCRYFPSDAVLACKTLNNGRAAIVPLTGDAYVLVRLTDYTFPAGPTLAYGTYWSASGRFRCDSSTLGMKCRSLRSGHGFAINRSGFKTF